MKKQNLITATAAVATSALLGLGGAALANAGQTTPAQVQADSSPTAGAGTADQGRRHGPKGDFKDRVLEHGLTGDAAVKVTQAAVTKEPTAYVLRVGKAADGEPYRAIMMRPDGTRIVLTIDANFTVTSVTEAPLKAPGHGRPGKNAKSGATPTATSGATG